MNTNGIKASEKNFRINYGNGQVHEFPTLREALAERAELRRLNTEHIETFLIQRRRGGEWILVR